MNDLVMPLGLMMVLSTLPAIWFSMVCEFIDYLKKAREQNDTK